MRIIAGLAGGIPIQVPKTTTRPTTDRVRESLFSTLGTMVEDARVLDLFAGSGSLGIESLSRGARSAIFVEQSRQACRIIQANLEKTDLADRATVVNSETSRFLDRPRPETTFDLVFADPPYARNRELEETLNRFFLHDQLPALLSPEGLLVLETSSRSVAPQSEPFARVSEKTYGETRLTYYRLNTDQDPS